MGHWASPHSPTKTSKPMAQYQGEIVFLFKEAIILEGEIIDSSSVKKIPE